MNGERTRTAGTRLPTGPLLARIVDDSRAEIQSMLENRKLGVWADLLLEELSKSDGDIRRLFDAGIDNLPSDTTRPNKTLARYFFVLSSLKGPPVEVRDFATDAMVYCKNDMDTPTGTADQIRRNYHDLRSLLEHGAPR
jgi:hypothetical protein